MATSSLYPPNCHSLSDVIIGGVVERVSAHYRRYEFPTERHNTIESTRTVSESPRTVETTPSRKSLGFITDVLSTKENNRLGQKSLVGMKRPPPVDAVAEPHQLVRKRGRPRKSLAQDDEHRGANAPQLSNNRRERCRINQARYRDRQRKHAVDLEEGINQLKAEVYKLELQKQSIVSCTPTNANAWKVAAEYFRLFRYGYMMPTMVTESSADVSTGTLGPTHSLAQLDFLRETMASDVTDGNLRGADAIFENWRLLTLYHQDVHVQLERLEKGPSGSLIATTTTSLTIAGKTLRYLFPHLVTDEEEDVERPSLASKMLNKQLVMRGSVHFDWDSDHGRVVRMESRSDMLTPMLQLLGSLEDVARVFHRARITPECKIVSTEE